ncbi:MAG: hypothetical protein ACJ8R9_05555 [Steroidobacteraceae bacterium]
MSAEQRIIETPAKRGDLFLLKVYRPALSLDGGTEKSVEFEMAEVTSITRKGRIKAYRIIDGRTSQTRSMPVEAAMIPASGIDVEAAKSAYIARHDSERAFKSQMEAKYFLTPFLKGRASALPR